MATDDQGVPIFADQIRQGMRISQVRPSSDFAGEITVTQVRDYANQIHILGLHDDGRPYAYSCAYIVPFICHDVLMEASDGD